MLQSFAYDGAISAECFKRRSSLVTDLPPRALCFLGLSICCEALVLDAIP